MDNLNKNQQFPQKTQVTPKCINNTDATRPTKKINKSSKPTNDIQPTPKIISESRDFMDVDSVDVTHHVRTQQQPISNTPVDLLENPWMDITPTVNHLDNVVHTQSKAQPFYSAPEASPINATSSCVLSIQNNTNVKKIVTLLMVDDSIHSPPKDKNRNKNSQTYDARVPVSDIPSTLPSEKSNFLQGWFRGIDALKRIYVDEIFNMDYFVLQFDNLSTMKKLVRNFNDDSETGVTMTPIVYV